MQARVLTIMLSGAIGLIASGCANTTPTMRAQSPHAHGGAHHNCPMCDSGYADAGVPMYDTYQCDNCDACRGACPGPCMNLPFHPVHRNFHTYDVPDDLCYPDPNQNPAMYQYPYYTHRGPTDFFMK